MSFFMISMALSGLMIEPAGVEADALADQRDFRDRPDRPSAARSAAARAVGGAADGVDQRKILLQQIVADDGLESLAP